MTEPTHSIEITTAIGCRNACTYCPQGRFIAAYAKRSSVMELSLETFTACLDHLPPKCRVYFSGFAEPWQNPRCTDFLERTCERGLFVYVFSTAVGMTLRDVERLKAAGIAERPTIHLPDDGGNVRIDVTDAYLEVLAELGRAFPDLVCVCPVFDKHGTGLHPRLQRHFRKVLDASEPAVPGDTRRPVLFYDAVGRAGHVPDRRVWHPPVRHGDLGLCGRVAGLTMLPNGDVALCCADYSLEHVLGNLVEHDLETILRSSTYRSLLRAHVDEREPLLCRRCEYATCPERSDRDTHTRLAKLYRDDAEISAVLARIHLS